MRRPGVAAVVINHNGAPDLPACLKSLLAQTEPVLVYVYDNASTDGSEDVVREIPGVTWVGSPVNLGYGAAANRAIRATDTPYVLVLNPDVVLEPEFAARLRRFADATPRAGSLTGKLLRFAGPGGSPVLDSTGHVIFRNRWVTNRGQGEPDRGQYDKIEEVFGVSGAASFYRRAMLDDVALNGEVFAEDFFLYFEDVDLDWRARLRGWAAYYVPPAVGYHERAAKGGHVHRDPVILGYSVRNRLLTLLRNDTLADVARDLPAILPMEALRLAELVLCAPSALRGYWGALRGTRAALAQRRRIQARRLASRAAIRPWFRPYPYRKELSRRLSFGTSPGAD